MDEYLPFILENCKVFLKEELAKNKSTEKIYSYFRDEECKTLVSYLLSHEEGIAIVENPSLLIHYIPKKELEEHLVVLTTFVLVGAVKNVIKKHKFSEK